MKCKCCAFEDNFKIFEIREMFLGFREIFNYQWCSNCGCMQLIDIPINLAKYYPSDKYYSFDNSLNNRKIKTDILRKTKASYILYGRNSLVGSLLSIGYKVPSFFEWLKRGKVKFDDSILDVGSGNGGLLASLYKNGFTNLTGIDPYISKDIEYGGFNIYKKDIFSLKGRFDFIMLNHVFEHIDNPGDMLIKLYELLNPGKFLLIRTPLMDNYIWKSYGTNWIGLDAPRHLIIHSMKSMKLLALEAGFLIEEIIFDGGVNNIIGSEQYKRDIALTDSNSRFVNKNSTLFSKQEIESFQILTEKANEQQVGDQAAFYLYKA